MQLDYGQKERECATRTASGPRALRSCSGHRLLSSPGNGGGRPLREVHAHVLPLRTGLRAALRVMRPAAAGGSDFR